MSHHVTSILPFLSFFIHVRSFGGTAIFLLINSPISRPPWGGLVAGAAQHRCEDECASHRCAGVGALGPLVVPQWFDASHCYVASSKNGGYCKHLNYPQFMCFFFKPGKSWSGIKNWRTPVLKTHVLDTASECRSGWTLSRWRSWR
jgi:hypothetical protein